MRHHWKDVIRWVRGYISTKRILEDATFGDFDSNDHAFTGSQNVVFIGIGRPEPFKGLYNTGDIGGMAVGQIGGGIGSLSDFTPTPPFSASDNFTRANNTTLGSNWTLNSGTWGINYNMAASLTTGTGSLAAVHWNAHSFGNDQFSETTLTGRPDSGGTAFSGPAVRMDASAQTWYHLVTDGHAWSLKKLVAGVSTTLASGTEEFIDGTVLRLEVIGSILTFYANSLQKSTITDSAISSGSAGMVSVNTSVPLQDSWSGGDL